MNKHNFAIDALRFFAAFAVVLFHLNQATPYAANWYRSAVGYGWLGVPVFFVVSGYCIALSANHSFGKGDFLNRRFFRIFPAYWISLLIVPLAACYEKIHSGSNSVQSLPDSLQAILAMITLTTAPLSTIKTMNWVYWSLTCELFFYLAVWLALFFNKKGMIWFLILLSVLVDLLPDHKTGIIFIFDQWPAFGMGIGIFYFCNRNGKLPGIGDGLMLLLNLYGLMAHFGNNYVAVTVVTALIILISNTKRLPENIFSTLGQYSYSVYLIHVPIGVFIFSIYEPLAVSLNPFANLAHDLVVYMLVSLASAMLFEEVEEPAIRFGRNISKRFFIGDNKKRDAQ